MDIRQIKLRNYRNYKTLNLQLNHGLNVIVGPNGSGKTNLVEAIYYLSLARSFRTNDDVDLIKNGEDDCVIEASLGKEKFAKSIKIHLNKEGKRIVVNDYPLTKLSELAKITNVIVFEPRDVLFFDDAPRVRRRFLDVTLSKHTKNYMQLLSRYEKVLRERNEILKKASIDQIQLEILTEKLIEASKPIVEHRKTLIERFNQIIPLLGQQLFGLPRQIKVVYTPFVTSEEQFDSEANKLFKRMLESDIKAKTTGNGVHREDFTITYEGHDITNYGSQGQKRLIALCVKLAPYFLVEKDGDKPIVVLDDVLSELDDNHQRNLIEFVKNFPQVFITTTTDEINDATVYKIDANSQITRRSAQ